MTIMRTIKLIITVSPSESAAVYTAAKVLEVKLESCYSFKSEEKFYERFLIFRSK